MGFPNVSSPWRNLPRFPTKFMPVVGAYSWHPLMHHTCKISFCRAKLWKHSLCHHAYAVMRCACVCLSRSYILSKQINISQNFFTFGYLYHSSFSIQNGMIIFRLDPPNRGVECRWGRQKSWFWANIWLHCVLWSAPAAGAIYLAVTNHGEFITLVTGEQPNLLMVGNNDEVYDKKRQRYAEDNLMQW